VQQLLEGSQHTCTIFPKRLHERNPIIDHRSGRRAFEQELVRPVTPLIVNISVNPCLACITCSPRIARLMSVSRIEALCTI
jgi:hypothetical protein